MSATKATSIRRCRVLRPSGSRQTPIEHIAAIFNNVAPVPEARRRTDDAEEPDPVVVIVRVTGTIVVDAVKVTVEGLKLQVL